MVAPADLRFLRKEAPDPAQTSVTGRIVSYLQNIYDSIAETLPDFRDCDDIRTTLASRGSEEIEDTYAKALSEGTHNKDEVINELLKPTAKKKRKLRSVVVDAHKQVPLEERWLPPGATMKDYWEQMCLSDPAEAVSFSAFWKAAHLYLWCCRFGARRMVGLEPGAVCCSGCGGQFHCNWFKPNKTKREVFGDQSSQ